MTTNTATDTACCLTDGATIYYPQGAGRVRAISLEDLADAAGLGDQQAAIFETRTADVGVSGLATASTRTLWPARPSSPPARWTSVSDPLGFPEDFADALADWLDWCDAEEQAADEAGALAVVSEAA